MSSPPSISTSVSTSTSTSTTVPSRPRPSPLPLSIDPLLANSIGRQSQRVAQAEAHAADIARSNVSVWTDLYSDLRKWTGRRRMIELNAFITAVYESPPTYYQLNWIDEEGDNCVMSTDSELVEAIDAAAKRGKILRIIIAPIEAKEKEKDNKNINKIPTPIDNEKKNQTSQSTLWSTSVTSAPPSSSSATPSTSNSSSASPSSFDIPADSTTNLQSLLDSAVFDKAEAERIAREKEPRGTDEELLQLVDEISQYPPSYFLTSSKNNTSSLSSMKISSLSLHQLTSIALRNLADSPVINAKINKFKFNSNHLLAIERVIVKRVASAMLEAVQKEDIEGMVEKELREIHSARSAKSGGGWDNNNNNNNNNNIDKDKKDNTANTSNSASSPSSSTPSISTSSSPSLRLLVSDLPSSAFESSFVEYFSRFGQLVSAKLHIEEKKGEIEYNDMEGVKECLKQKIHIFDGKCIKVKSIESPKK